jgi:hypothetical protein
MTLCPIALAIGCKKCPVFSICPLKTIIGNYKPPQTPPASPVKDQSPGRDR